MINTDFTYLMVDGFLHTKGLLKKIEIMSIIDDFRRLADTIEFGFKRNLLNNLKGKNN